MTDNRRCLFLANHASVAPVVLVHESFVPAGLVVATQTADDPRTLNHGGQANDGQPAALVTYDLRLVFLEPGSKRRGVLPM